MDLPSRPKGLEQDSPLLFPGGWAKSEYQSGPIQSSELMLEYNPAEDNWKRNCQNPLEGDLVVIDEGSMVELEVAYRLFDAIPLSANVLIIGDDNQIPSVGGKPNAQQPGLVQSTIARLPEGAEIVAAFDADEAGHLLAHVVRLAVASVA